MRHTGMFLVAALVVPALVHAHVGIQPRESKAAAVERYTVRVPTEGAVTTTSVHLEIPDGVTVLDVEAIEGVEIDIQRAGDRVVGITWKTEIPPRESRQFFFRARNPAEGDRLSWKAHQHFADGTVTDWVGPPGDPRPAPLTTVVR